MQYNAYVRIFADDDGESHFEDVVLPAEARQSPVSSAQVEITAPIAAREVMFRRVVVDHPAEPHVAPRRQLVVHLAGEAEIEVSDGEVRRFGPGSVVLVDDLAGKGHVTRRVGPAPRETLFIVLADEAETR